MQLVKLDRIYWPLLLSSFLGFYSQFLERDSEEENDLQVARRRMLQPEDNSGRASEGVEEETMDSCDREHDGDDDEVVGTESLSLEIASPVNTSPIDPPLIDDSAAFPVVCSLFYRDAGSGAIATGLMPFTMILRHNEPVSSLLTRVRHHLCLRSDAVEKWRLAILSGPISPNCAAIFPLAPTQESLLRMRSSYKYITAGIRSTEEARIDLTAFLPAPFLRRCGEKKALLYFGLRPWLGIEMPIAPVVPPYKGIASALLTTSGLHPSQHQHPGVGAAKRKPTTCVGKSVLSEKPIRIWN